MVGISPRILMNMAAMYTDENRVYMEYVDNSLDAAEKFFNAKTNSYFLIIGIIF